MDSLKHSLRFRLAVILVVVSVGTTLAGSIIYSTFLRNYVEGTKVDSLNEIYNDMNSVFVNDPFFGMVIAKEEELEKLRVKGYNLGIQILVVDTSYRTKYANVPSDDIEDSENLLSRLKGIIFDAENDIEITDILATNSHYKMYIYKNLETDREYIEMWGELNCGYLFLMRITNESISEQANIANRFYINIAFVMTGCGVLSMMVIANKVTRPIRELAIVSGKSKDEIGVLGESMNEMSAALEKTISELKYANNELKKDIEAKTEIDELRKEFISNVSHELKTPIALIQGYAEGLKESVNDDEESREFYCDVIVDEAAKMNKIVKKLLTLNQIEFGNMLVEYERFDIVQTVDNILNQTRILLAEKEVQVDFDNTKQVYVWADEYQIEEVITNYISNAINHLKNEKILRITIDDDNGIATIKVFNTGDHIPEESLERIWDKFYKVDKARTREYGGSGIGLSIVKAIMDSIHMKCGVENLPGGVEFWFELESGQDLKK